MRAQERDGYAQRAIRAHAAMRTAFFDSHGGLYRPRRAPRLPGTAEHLWPVARALVATLDLAGAGGAARLGFDTEAEIAVHLQTLERYWEPPAYRSDPRGAWLGGEHYYDDNAWVGLALVQLERLRPGSGRLQRAERLFRFAIGGWDRQPERPYPGGVFWVQQGRGAGRRNHDRNTVSNAPNAQLGLHLADLGQLRPARLVEHARRMYGWVRRSLADGEGLFYDKVRGDGSIDRTRWSYNQGSMVGAGVLLARVAGESGRYLVEAEQLARRALEHYSGAWGSQPAAFNAICFRNLLLLRHASGDAGLRGEIDTALLNYAETLWSEHRGADDLVRIGGRRPSLLDQSGLVQVLALLAWDPADYGRLA